MRNFLIAGNWKMHCGPSEAVDLVKGVRSEIPDLPGKVDVLFCPPYVSLESVSRELAGYDGARVGAQNVHFEEEGAFTGEVSAGMLTELECEYVIVGHSERREYFGETDRTVNLKIKKAVEHDLVPVVCVGESLQQRKTDKHVQRVKKQVQAACTGLDTGQASEIVFAYEPIWAIGTGETATPEQAQEMHGMIRSEMNEQYGTEVSDGIRILYGGSMKPHNAESLLGQPDVDGGLIGGASLKPDSFAEIIRIADRLS